MDNDQAGDVVVIADMWASLMHTAIDMSVSARRGQTDDFVLLREGMSRIQEALAAVEPRCRASGLALQSRLPFDPFDRGRRLDRASRGRGVHIMAIAAPAAGIDNPFLRAAQPHTRCGPVMGAALLLDRACAVVPGLRTTYGADTAWLTTRPEVVRQVARLWDLTSKASIDAVATDWPIFTARQLSVACLAARGQTRDAIARDLGLSVRTVAGELSRLRGHLPA